MTVTKEGVIEPTEQPGVTVQADQVVNLIIFAKPAIKTIGTVTTRASSDLVKPGTTSDVYNVNEAAQARTSVLGGGGSSDQGYSAIAALPGAYVPPGNSGWFQSVYIRGGDYDQVGYEFDGVPVNRSFDNYPTTNLSALGQQELQLYTGASPASAESSGLAGYINQVIKTGTYPGFGAINLGIGGPQLYNKANMEFGGATPNRNFSYYIAAGLVDYAPRYIDNSDGASYTQLAGTPFDITSNPNGCSVAQPCPGLPPVTSGPGCSTTGSDSFGGCYANTAYFGALPIGPGGYQMGSFTIGGGAHLSDRESIFNFHFGIPHKHDAGKDDIQFLYNTFLLYTYYYGSINDWGGQAFYNNDQASGCVNCPGTVFTSAHQYTPGVGAIFTSADPTQSANVVNYAYASEGAAGLGGPIPLNKRDTADNGQGIYKLQWQRNIGTSSYFRLYGYLFYSWWYLHGPNTTQATYAGCCPEDYELWTHTRGLSAQYVNQLSNKHLLNVEGSYSTASTVRDNNTQQAQCFGPNVTGCGGQRDRFGFLVSAANPTNGLCYDTTSPGVPFSCEPSNPSSKRPDILTYSGASGVKAIGVPAPSGTACGGPCAWLIAENGPWATYNTVTPRFWAGSIQDTWKPNDKLNLNIGLRDDVYTFLYTPTGGGTRPFWFNAWNAANCANPLFNGGSPFDMTNAMASGLAFNQPAGSSCAAYGAGFVSATITNSTAAGGSITYNELEPRFGGTYTFGADDVLRFSAGRYSQAANAAFQQYNSLDQNLPNHLLGSLFYKFGFTTPNHIIRPSISNNYDISFEHRFANSQTSFKLTPFLRQTTDQVQQIFIDPKTAFVSGLNAGRETNTGVEFLLNLGNFNANGWAGQFAYTYTKSTIKYTTLPNGGTVLDSDNQDIQKYNAFTSACAGVVGSANPLSQCGVLTGVGAPNASGFPCFDAITQAGKAICTAADTANPYFNQKPQALFSPTASYAPYDIVPAGVQLSAQGYVTPHAATAVLQWKHDKWTFIPAFQFHSGQVYGSPETMFGFNPSTCGTTLASAIAGDPRYPAGGSGGAADATTCSGSIVIPNTYTGKFDGIGAFTEPSQFSGHMTIGYEATPRVSYSLALSNIINTCFGGSTEPWTMNDHHICAYGVRAGNVPPVGNFYNPTSTIQSFAKFPYQQFASTNGLIGYTTPFSLGFGVNVKL